MKKFLSFVLCLLLVLGLVACGKEPEPQPQEDTTAIVKEAQKGLSITYAEGDSATSVTKDITLVADVDEGITVTWESDKDALKIEGNKGVVTRGDEDIKVKITAKITYKDATITKPFAITIKSNGPTVVEANEVKVEGATELEVGDESLYTAIVLPEDAVDKEVVWTTSNDTIAVVEQNGLVTAMSVGEVTIFAALKENAEVKGEIKVNISEKIDLNTISNIINFEDGTEVKVRASIVAKNGDGYLLYDETGYMMYTVADATQYANGDYLEFVGAIKKADGKVSFDETVKVEKIADSHFYDLKSDINNKEALEAFLADLTFAKYVKFNATITEVNDDNVVATIDGIDGITLGFVKVLDKTLYEVGKQYEVSGFALNGTENNLNIMLASADRLYTVTFVSGYDATVEPIVFSNCKLVELPELIRDEYVFVCWQENGVDVEALTENRDYTLTAYMVQREYEVVEYETNGGELTFVNQLIVRDFNTYDGYLKKYDSFTLYKKGSSSKAWASSYYHNLFLKRVEGETNIYKVTYKAGSGTDIDGFLDGVEHPYDFILSSNSTNALNSVLTGLYNDEYIYDYFFYMNIPDSTPKDCYIQVVWDLEKAKANLDVFKNEVDNELPTCTLANYEFLGWYDNPELSGETISFHEKGKTKYYASYKPIDFTITYELNEAQTEFEFVETYNIESEDILLPTADQLVKPDFTFLGWFDNADAGGTPYEKIAKGSFGDKTLYACFAENAVKELKLSAADVAAFNKVTPNIIVCEGAKTGNYKVVGEGLDAKYNDAVYPSGTVYATLEAAILAAKEYDVIYVMAGTYGALTISVANVKLIGPNFGVKGTEERVAEASIEGAFVADANGITVDGLKFAGAGNVMIQGSNFTIQNCYVNGACTRLGSANRKACIAGNDNPAYTLTDIVIKDNYIKVPGSGAGYTAQYIAFDKVTNLKVTGNYITNEATAQGTAGTEVCMIYNPCGEIEFSDNTFELYSGYAALRLGYNGGSFTKLDIVNNVFKSSVTNGEAGGIILKSIPQDAVVNILGNEFTVTQNYNKWYFELHPLKDSNDETINLNAGTINIKYNAFLGKAFAFGINDLDFSGLKTTFVYENNYFASISADDPTGAADSTKYDTLEAYYAAVAEWRGSQEVKVVDYNISYVLQGGTCAEENLPEKYNIETEDIVLPTADKMSITDGTFIGWFDNANGIGDPITTIAKGSTGDKILYACWNITVYPVIETTAADKAAIAKYAPDFFVKAGADQVTYDIDGVRYTGKVFGTLNDAIKAIDATNAAEQTTIYVFAGDYELVANSDCTLMPVMSKALRIVGPNAEIKANEEREPEANVNVTMQIYMYGKTEFIGLNVYGKGATTKSSNGNNFFYISGDGSDYLGFVNCKLSKFRTAIYYIKGTTNNTKAELYFDGCSASEMGQFLVWGDTGSTLSKLTFVNGYVDNSSNGGQNTASQSLFRIRCACESIIYNNYFVNDSTKNTKDGYNLFENSATDDSVMKIMYNTFKNVKKYVFVKDGKKVQFNNNLYLDAEGTALTAVPTELTGKGVVTDIEIATSDEDRLAKYNTYLTKGDKFIITFELDEGTCSETLPEYGYEKDDAIVLPTADKMSKENYTFVGWFDNATGTGTALTEIAKGTNLNQTIYAVWCPNSVQDIYIGSVDANIMSNYVVELKAFVCPNARYGTYKLIGNGVSNELAALEFVYGVNYFATINEALANVENGVIYVTAGTYDEIVTINNDSITLVGPNEGKAGNAASRYDDPIITGLVTINGDNVSIIGFKFIDNAAIKINGNNTKIAYSIINSAAVACGANNRLGVITSDGSPKNVVVQYNLINPSATAGGYKAQFITFDNVTNLYFGYNVVTNTAATSTSNEASMIYRPNGYIKIENNEFKFYNATALFNIGYYETASPVYVSIKNNTFSARDEAKADSAGIRIRKLPAGSRIDIIGNEFNITTADVIRNMISAANIVTNVKYNVFNCASTGYCLRYVDGDAANLTTVTSVTNYVDNYYNAIADNDNSGAIASLADAEAVVTAYATYKENYKGEIFYFLEGGACTEDLVTSLDTDVVLPTADKMTKKGYTFLGWYDADGTNYTTVTASAAAGEVLFVYAKWHNQTLTVNPTKAGAYKTLADALADALAGDTIVLAAGNYNEDVTVTKNNITIQGAKSYNFKHDATYEVGAEDTVIKSITASNIANLVIKNVVITNNINATSVNGLTVQSVVGKGAVDGFVLIKGTTNNVVVKDLFYFGSGARIVYVYNGLTTNLTVDNLVVMDSALVSFDANGKYATGVCDAVRFGVDNNTYITGTVIVKNCYIRAGQGGIMERKTNATKYVVLDNTFVGIPAAIYFRTGTTDAIEVEVTHNTFIDCGNSITDWDVVCIEPISTTKFSCNYNAFIDSFKSYKGTKTDYDIKVKTTVGTVDCANNYFSNETIPCLNATGLTKFESLEALETAYAATLVVEEPVEE